MLLVCLIMFLNLTISKVFKNYSVVSLMMEAVRTSETLVNFNVTTLRNIPEDSKLHTRRHENLKSHIFIHFLFLNDTVEYFFFPESPRFVLRYHILQTCHYVLTANKGKLYS
jgi:hypothetical protein